MFVAHLSPTNKRAAKTLSDWGKKKKKSGKAAAKNSSS